MAVITGRNILFSRLYILPFQKKIHAFYLALICSCRSDFTLFINYGNFKNCRFIIKTSRFTDRHFTYSVENINYKLFTPGKDNMLTKRELEVLELLIQGYSNTEISDKLMITKHTTKAHVASIFEKLEVNNRVQATVKYLKEIHSI